MSIHQSEKPPAYFCSFQQHQEYVARHQHLLFLKRLDGHEDTKPADFLSPCFFTSSLASRRTLVKLHCCKLSISLRGERETPTLTPLSAPCHQNGQSYAMINPFPTPKYIQGYSKKIGKISYTLWFGLGFFSPGLYSYWHAFCVWVYALGTDSLFLQCSTETE